jgi:hypothetical protein
MGTKRRRTTTTMAVRRASGTGQQYWYFSLGSVLSLNNNLLKISETNFHENMKPRCF